MRGTLLGVPGIRNIVFWGLYWGTLVLANYHKGLGLCSVRCQFKSCDDVPAYAVATKVQETNQHHLWPTKSMAANTQTFRDTQQCPSMLFYFQKQAVNPKSRDPKRAPDWAAPVQTLPQMGGAQDSGYLVQGLGFKV